MARFAVCAPIGSGDLLAGAPLHACALGKSLKQLFSSQIFGKPRNAPTESAAVLNEYGNSAVWMSFAGTDTMKSMTSPRLILASSSTRRRELLSEAGYSFEIIPPHESAECGVCSRETPLELVARLARQKAADVAARVDEGVVVGCDTVAECCGHILGKPANREHARQMLDLLRGREHHVYSGLCVWCRPSDQRRVEVAVTRLVMDAISDAELDAYLATGAWEGKAGAFGYQDGLDWVHVVEGSESNVVGLPMELLERMLRETGNGSELLL
jgi:septum formation protein